MDSLPFSQACENNKRHILAVLRDVFADCRQVLEIGSGTGQHACFFAANMPWLQWQPTDLRESLPLLRTRCALYGGDNLQPERALDVRDQPWPLAVPEAVFTANSLHIMGIGAVRDMFTALGADAQRDTVLVVYGPFNYGGAYTSESNARFDEWLKKHDPLSGIRDVEAVNGLADAAGFALERDVAMPANNRLLVWRRKPAGAAP